MKILALNCYLHLMLLLFNESLKQAFTQSTDYNQCNIKHCMECDQKTQLCTQCEKSYYFQREELLCLSIVTCPIGKYKLTKDSDCSDCFHTCKTCNGSERKYCIGCVDGYYLTSEQFYQPSIFCKTCSVKNCLKCYMQGVCNVCADGYIVNKFTGACDPCQVDQCQECNTNSTSCDLCFSSYSLQTKVGDSQICVLKGDCAKKYYKDQTGSCTAQCDISCKHCYGAGNENCYECDIGYFLSGNACKKCNSQCTSCKYSADYCTSCSSGKMLNGSKCLQYCNSGEYNNNGKCESCGIGCLACSDFNTCTKCLDNIQKTLSDGKCINICPKGNYNQLSDNDQRNYDNFQFAYIQSKPNCLQCSSDCKECLIQSKNCTECKDGDIFRNGYCSLNCLPNEYQVYDPIFKMQRCLACPFPCDQCDNRFSCKTCVSSYTLSNGKCVQSGYKYMNCDEGQVQFKGFCLDKCPESTNLQGDICQCDFSCINCVITLNTLQVQCIQCQNQNNISFNGECFAKCPKNYYQIPFEYPQNKKLYYYDTCVEKCPSEYPYILISLDKRECVTKCTFDSTLDQMCIYLSCKSGTYFDYDDFGIALNNQKDLNDKSLYCKTCDSTCATCDGKQKNNCITCADTYMIQKKTSSNNLTNTFCVLNCDNGYYKTKQLEADDTYTYTCNVCLKICNICLPNYYKILSSLLSPQLNNISETPQYDCYDKCPTGTEAEDTLQECRVKTTINVYFDQSDSYQNKFSFQSNINVVLQIFTILQFSSSLNPVCTLVELNLVLYLKNYGDEKFSKYLAVIPSGALEEGTKYNVKCSANINRLSFVDTQILETFQLVKGNFESNKNSGYAVNETFSFSIKGFYLKDINPDLYVLKYKIDAEIETINISFRNITIFKTDIVLFHDRPELVKNFAYIFNYTFPQIKIPITVKIYLTVYGASTLKRVFNISIQLKPYIETYNLQIITAALKNILSFAISSNNYQLDLSDLKQFSNQLKSINILPYLENAQKYNITQQKILLNQPFIDHLINCNSKSDCTGNGTCKTNIISFYSKCTCNDGYAGETCAWKKLDLELVKKVYFNSLDIINSEILGLQLLSQYELNDKLDNIVEQLINIASIRDVFDINFATKFLEIISKSQLYSVQNTQSTSTKLLQLNDYAIDILRKIKIEQVVTIEQINQIKGNIKQSLFIQAQYLNPGQDQSFNFSNVNGQLKDLCQSLYGQNSDIFMEATDSNLWRVKIPSSQLGLVDSYLFLQVIEWPSDLEELVHNYSDSDFSLFGSNIIDITIRQRDEPNEEYPIENSNEQIEITLNRHIIDSDLAYFQGTQRLNCTYQLENGTWTSFGLDQDENENGNSIKCLSNHLTNFALRIVKFISKNYADDSIKEKVLFGGFNQLTFLIMNFIVLLVTGHVWAFIVVRKQMKLINNQRNQAQSLELQQQSLQLQSLQQQRFEVPGSILNYPSPLLDNIDQDNILEGIHITINEEPKIIEDFPIVNLDNGSNQQENNEKPRKVQNLKINQIDMNTDNKLQRNAQKQEKISQNITRRVKVSENTFCHEENQKSQKDYNSREVNLIRLSTFYQPLAKSSPQSTTRKPTEQFQHDTYTSYALELNVNHPLPTSINEQEEEKIETNKSLNNKPLIKEKQIEDFANQELISYHPIFSFSRNLQSVFIPIRIFLFFQIFSLYQLLTLISIIKPDHTSIHDMHAIKIIQAFFQVMIIKSILQYAIPLFIFLISVIEKFRTQRTKYSSSQIMKYICILLFNLYSLIEFTIQASSIQTMSDFSEFIFVLVINVFFDYFILDFVVIKIQQCCKWSFVLKIIKYKNLDIKY